MSTGEVPASEMISSCAILQSMNFSHRKPPFICQMVKYGVMLAGVAVCSNGSGPASLSRSPSAPHSSSAARFSRMATVKVPATPADALKALRGRRLVPVSGCTGTLAVAVIWPPEARVLNMATVAATPLALCGAMAISWSFWLGIGSGLLLVGLLGLHLLGDR
ncbi:MAG: hypothetical protein LC798_08330 [Chloroflexi bacterium]|nr:hypothetical protein [Chloroflexota bacterium]